MSVGGIKGNSRNNSVGSDGLCFSMTSNRVNRPIHIRTSQTKKKKNPPNITKFQC